MAPCGSPQQAQTCGVMMIALERIANDVNHPLRLRASVAMHYPEDAVQILQDEVELLLPQ